MSSARPQPSTLLFIDKLTNSPKKVDAAQFGKSGGFAWTNKIIISEDDEKKVFENRHQIKSTKCDVIGWNNILSAQSKEVENKVAIYQTGIEGNLGLKALSAIKIKAQDLFLPYPGLYSSEVDKSDASHAYTLWTENVSLVGEVNGKNYRHYATFANTSFSSSDLANYTFSTSEIQKTVALPNMGMMLIFRPDEVRYGPLFWLGLTPLRDIAPGEPIQWIYADNYFLDHSNNSCIERFFNRFNGEVIDINCYKINEYLVRIWVDGIHYEVPYSEAELSSKDQLFGQLPDNKIIVVDYLEIKSAIDKKPQSRYLLFSKPSVIFKDKNEYIAGSLSKIVEGFKGLGQSPTPEVKHGTVTIKQLNNQGTAKYKSGHFKEAADIFKKAIVQYEQNPQLTAAAEAARLYYNLGSCQLNLKEYSAASSHLAKALLFAESIPEFYLKCQERIQKLDAEVGSKKAVIEEHGSLFRLS